MLAQLVNPIIQAGEVNITAFPSQLNEKLLIGDLWLAEYVASFLLISLSLLVMVVVTRAILPSIMVSFLVLTFCVAIEWLDGWIMIFLCMLVAGLFTFDVISDWVR